MWITYSRPVESLLAKTKGRQSQWIISYLNIGMLNIASPQIVFPSMPCFSVPIFSAGFLQYHVRLAFTLWRLCTEVLVAFNDDGTAILYQILFANNGGQFKALPCTSSMIITKSCFQPPHCGYRLGQVLQTSWWIWVLDVKNDIINLAENFLK